ncbi:hypothetical protein [Haliscomenobacter sp.]|uniref:hypothetical protein n=1 Tax=Haliscomenobacter sp. TaxID=2717303 RepID=UPI003BABC5B5
MGNHVGLPQQVARTAKVIISLDFSLQNPAILAVISLNFLTKEQNTAGYAFLPQNNPNNSIAIFKDYF